MKNIKLLFAVLTFVIAFSFTVSAQTVSLTSLDGEKVDVQGQKGKVVILAIGARWLPLSNQQAIFTNKLAKKFVGRDVLIYFVMTDSISTKSKNYASDEKIREFAVANKMNVTILRDSDGVVTLKKFNIDQLPSFIILGKDGKPVAEPFSGIDPKSDISVPIAREVEKLL